jgi:hypothetical protein
MERFVEGDDRKQVALLHECVDHYIGQDDPVRIVDVFLDELDLTALGFNGTFDAQVIVFAHPLFVDEPQAVHQSPTAQVAHLIANLDREKCS